MSTLPDGTGTFVTGDDFTATGVSGGGSMADATATAADDDDDEASSSSEETSSEEESTDDDDAPKGPPPPSRPSDVKGLLEEAGLKLEDVRTGAFDELKLETEEPTTGLQEKKPYEVQEWRVDENGTAYRRGMMRYPNGDTYDGEWVDGKRHGNGQFLYKNGDKYVGEFVAGKYEGFGVMAYAPFRENGKPVIGRRYQGHFKEGLKHGEGLYIVGNGDVYEGDFAYGVFHGHGKYQYADGSQYEGQWDNGQWEGHGKLRLKNTDNYRGEFKEGRMHGEGTYKWRRKTGSYTGTFRFNRRHGHGRRLFVNGAVYDGEYVNNKMTGECVFRRGNGDVFIGSVVDDRFHGNGTLQMAVGDRYVGQFQRGVFCGRGRYEYADGGFYDGEYFAIKEIKGQDVVFLKYDGKRHGHGVRVWSNGNRYEGTWLDDEMNGFGVQTGVWSGVYQVYEGMFERNNRNGKGIAVYGNTDRIPFTCPRGRRHDGRVHCKYDGEWRDGRFHGHGTYSCADGWRYEGGWRNDKRDGTGTQVMMGELDRGEKSRMFIRGLGALYRAEGYEGAWVKDVRHGEGALTFENGDRWEGTFVRGHLHGPVKCFIKSGLGGRRHEMGALYERGVRVRWLTDRELKADKALKMLAKKQDEFRKHLLEQEIEPEDARAVAGLPDDFDMEAHRRFREEQDRIARGGTPGHSPGHSPGASPPPEGSPEGDRGGGRGGAAAAAGAGAAAVAFAGV